MRTLVYSTLALCAFTLSTSTATANQGPPPKPKDPAPKPADPMTPLAGLGAAAGAVALGVWFLRRSTTRPGN